MSQDSQAAFSELIDLLTELNTRWAGPEWNYNNEADVAGAHRLAMHLLQTGLVTFHENDPSAPTMRPLVNPYQKMFGDNPDAVYYEAPVSDQYEYVIRGKAKGAVYFSVTLEAGTEDGSMSARTVGVLNDTQIDLDADGAFELRLGGAPSERNWLAIPSDASRVTTRHYYEEVRPAAANPAKDPEWEIERVGAKGSVGLPQPQDIAASIRRITQFMKSRTLDRPPFGQGGTPPPFVNLQPNTFPKPVVPGDYGLAATDAHYCMTPYYVGPGQALVIRGRWPTCRSANLVLWNRFMQTYDYINHQVWLNRAHTQLEADGSFKMILAHEDPGLPNWISTQGQPFGLAFWRFMMAEGDVETPVAELVELADLKG